MTSKTDLARYHELHRIGCIVAYLFYGAYRDADIHHLTEGGRRLGNQFTIPLSPWTHRGVCDTGWTVKEMETTFGPSLARNKRLFVATYGTERYLLEKVDALIDLRMGRKTA